MEKLKVKYSNGQTSRLYDAEVCFFPHKFGIEYTDESGAFCTVDWDIERINGTKFGVSFNHSLTYGDFPFQTIHADAQFFRELQAGYPQLELTDSTSDLVKKKTWQTIIVLLSLIIVFILCAYFFFIPAMADKVVQSIPRKYEAALGRQIYDRNMATFRLNTDSGKSRLVNEYFRTLGVTSPTDSVHITVVDCNEANAFAMPGGYIVVYSGLLAQMKNHEELAGVLTHEYGHVHHRHTLRSMARSVANYAVISLVIGDVSGLAGVIVENADNVRSLQYSRELETEADNYAFEQLDRRNVNPEGIIWLFHSLAKAHEESGIQISVPEFLSTHPDTQKRIENIENRLKSKPKVYPENERLQVIWGLIKK